MGLITQGIAGLAGGIGGGLAAGNKAKSDKATLREYIKQQEQLQKEIGSTADLREQQATDAYAPQLEGYGENSQAYFDKLKNADFSKYDVSAPEDYKGQSIQELIAQNYNPQAQSMIDAEGNSVQGSAANAGNLFSGVTAGNIARATAQEQGNQYASARDAATQQYGQKYKEFTDKFANVLAANDVNKGNLSANLNAGGTLYNAQTDAFGNQRNEVTGVQQARDSAIMSSRGEQATAAAQKKGVGGYWSNFASGALSGLSKGLGG